MALTEFIDRGYPVIPVLLPGAPEKPKLPLFLKGFTWVDLRGGLTDEGLDLLIWGITGKKPNPKKSTAGSRTPRLHNLPFLPLGDLLKGRDEEMQRLITNLQNSTQAAMSTQTAIYGLGGIGKTRLAVEYAWRSGDRYDTALFVVADSPEALHSGLANLARPGLLNLPEYEVGAETKTVEAVLQWFRNSTRWLLILDNVDTKEAAYATQEILSRLKGGHSLITTRMKNWPTPVSSQALATLSPRDAAEFLLKRTASSFVEPSKSKPQETKGGKIDRALQLLETNQDLVLLILDPQDPEYSRNSALDLLNKIEGGNILVASRPRSSSREFLLQRTEGVRVRTQDDIEQAGLLAEALGCLPLALEQAAAYIVHHQMTFAHYLHDWEIELRKVLEWHAAIREYPTSLAATWQKTFNQLRPQAAAVLRLTAFLTPEPIPEAMFEDGGEVIENAAEAVRAEMGKTAIEWTINDALAELATYSMITRSVGYLTVPFYSSGDPSDSHPPSFSEGLA